MRRAVNFAYAESSAHHATITHTLPRSVTLFTSNFLCDSYAYAEKGAQHATITHTLSRSVTLFSSNFVTHTLKRRVALITLRLLIRFSGV
jgi:hypothetical protein